MVYVTQTVSPLAAVLPLSANLDANYKPRATNALPLSK